ncbi:hypothetical protein PUN28_000674 [Cardiocondyla obscurior]|uniref:Ribosomal protein L34 n=1 Tax=Cardiocondyla obscurior TaxID=286306 RepID=A0AAW2H0X7_9HYME
MHESRIDRPTSTADSHRRYARRCICDSHRNRNDYKRFRPRRGQTSVLSRKKVSAATVGGRAVRLTGIFVPGLWL